MQGIQSAARQASPDDLYKHAMDNFGPSLARLVNAYEADPEKRRDLSQDIHFQLWRSFQWYDSRCSLRTWIYRVAHHVAAAYVIRERRTSSTLVSLEELETLPVEDRSRLAAEAHVNLSRLSKLIQRLKPLDRQVILCWLEGLDSASISEITGLAPGSIVMRITALKASLRGNLTEEAAMPSNFDDDLKAVWQDQRTEVSR